MSSKVRVYEVARELGIDSKALVTKFQELGFADVRNHMSVVSADGVEQLRRTLGGRPQDAAEAPAAALPRAVVKRRSRRVDEGGVDTPSSPVGSEVPPEPAGATLPSPPAVSAGGGASDDHPRVVVIAAPASPPSDGGHAAAASTDLGAQRDAAPDAGGPRVSAPEAERPAAAAAHPVAPSGPSLSGIHAPDDADQAPPTPAVVTAPVAVAPTAAAPGGSDPGDGVGADDVAPTGAARSGMVAQAPQPMSSPVIKRPGARPSAAAMGDARPERPGATPSVRPGAQPSAMATGQGRPGAQPSAMASGQGRPGAQPAAQRPGAQPASGGVPGAVQRRPGAAPAAPPGGVRPGIQRQHEAERAAALAAAAPRPEAPPSPTTVLRPGGGPGHRAGAQPASGAPGGQRPGAVPATRSSDLAERAAAAAAASAAATAAATAAAASARPGARPAAPGAGASQPPPATGGGSATQPPPSQRRKTGIEVWEGRPGVTVTQPRQRRQTFEMRGPGGGPGGPPGRRGPGGRPMGPGGRPRRGIGSFKGRAGGQVVTQERSAHKKLIRIEGGIGLQALAAEMGVKATDLLRIVIKLGLPGRVHINTQLDADTAKIVANELGWDIEDVEISEEEAIQAAQEGLDVPDTEEGDELPRPPVVTVMGHVDHGKTSLLDAIRNAAVAAGEAGGITQHIGAYSVQTPRGPVTFLDTPGHEAFTAMRARGAKTTDIVVLVCAADDGVMPQTIEAISHARAAEVPIVVAINKCDKPDAQPERVRRELSEQGLVPEEWGGDTLVCEVSAVTKAGIDHLLEQIMLQAEVLELTATPDGPATCIVIEAKLDRGRGPLATVLISQGTLRRGDAILSNNGYGKVRLMLDDRGREVEEATPSTPVEVVGLNKVPSAGEHVYVVKDLKAAEKIIEGREERERQSQQTRRERMTLDEIAEAMSRGNDLELKIIVKADVQGSAEAVAEALTRLSTEKVAVKVIHKGVGAITEGDVNLAVAAGAVIIGFNVRPAGKAGILARQEKVDIRQYSVIYDAVDAVKLSMEGMLAPTFEEREIGQAEVRAVFRVSKAGTVAGCMVTSGVIKRNALARLMREGKQIWEGKIASLKRFKDDAKEVREGFECGIGLDGFSEIVNGDVIAVFDLQEVKQTL